MKPERPPREPDLVILVHGEAKPAGSKVSGVATKIDKASGRRVPVMGPKGFPKTFTKDSSGAPGKAWRENVASAGAEAKEEADLDLFRGPMWVDFHFYIRRRKGHLSAKGGVLPSAPLFPQVRPDKLKLTRAVEDALSAVVYEDDSLIVGGEELKMYAELGDGDHCEVRIWSLPEKVRDLSAEQMGQVQLVA